MKVNISLIEELSKEYKEEGIPVPDTLLRGQDFFREIPAQVRQLTDRQMAEMVMVANTQRKDMSAIDLAVIYKRYLEEFKNEDGSAITQAELAVRLKKSQGEISNTIRLLELPDSVQEKVISREISERHGRELLRLNRLPEMQQQALASAIEQQTPVSKLARYIDDILWYNTKSLNPRTDRDKPAFALDNCAGCEHKVRASNPLDPEHKEDRCLNEACWEEKNAAAVRHAAEEADAATIDEPAPPDNDPEAPARSDMPCATCGLWETCDSTPLVKQAGGTYTCEKKTPEAVKRGDGPPPGLIPEGVRYCPDVPDEECRDCAFAPTDHTLGHKFKVGNVSYKVCLKDYYARFGKPAPEEVELAAAAAEPIPVSDEFAQRIAKSHSSYTIREKCAVHHPFEYEGLQMICTGSLHSPDVEEYECYLMVSREDYEEHGGEPRTYSGSDFAERRLDPLGFYNGMLVKHGKEECVLAGPQYTFRCTRKAEAGKPSVRKPAPEPPGTPMRQLTLKEKAGTVEVSATIDGQYPFKKRYDGRIDGLSIARVLIDANAKWEHWKKYGYEESEG